MLIQIGVAFVIVFSVSTVLLGMLVAVGATRLFLGSKEDMVEQDLTKLYNSFEGLPYRSWAMKYWEQHAEAIKEKRTDSNYEPESNETVSKALTFPYTYTDEQLDSLSEEDQLALGTHLYNMTYNMFLYTSFNYQYESAYVIDISEENRGFVFITTDVLAHIWTMIRMNTLQSEHLCQVITHLSSLRYQMLIFSQVKGHI